MRSRLAFFAASLAASGVLAAGLAVVGLSSAPVPAADSTITAPATDAPPAPITQIDTENPTGIPIGRPIRGTVARVRAGTELNVRFDPDLSDKVAKEAGCALNWTY